MAILLIITILFLGLMAGLFYSWSISVTPGLARLNDEHYLRAFQAMNRAILNPVFFIVFFGLVFLLPLLTYQTYQGTFTESFIYIFAAALLYIAGIMAVTIMGNIPLNNALESLNINTMSKEQMADFRNGFEKKWNVFNMIRATSSSMALILLILAIL